MDLSRQHIPSQESILHKPDLQTMVRTKQTARMTPARMAPRKELATIMARRAIAMAKCAKKVRVVSKIKKSRFDELAETAIPKQAFGRLVKEILQDISGFKVQYQIRKEAITALQETAEEFVIGMLGDASKYAIHAKRVTISPKDLNLAKSIRGIL